MLKGAIPSKTGAEILVIVWESKTYLHSTFCLSTDRFAKDAFTIIAMTSLPTFVLSELYTS